MKKLTAGKATWNWLLDSRISITDFPKKNIDLVIFFLPASSKSLGLFPWIILYTGKKSVFSSYTWGKNLSFSSFWPYFDSICRVQSQYAHLPASCFSNPHPNQQKYIREPHVKKKIYYFSPSSKQNVIYPWTI